MPQLIVENLLISYYQSSSVKQSESQTLLFLHGWRSNKEIWRLIIEKLQAEEHQTLAIYAFDLPGFGQSQMPPRPMTVGSYADITAQFIKKLNLKNVILIGHSFGGRVGIKFAAARPELISKLVLVDSGGIRDEQAKKTILKLLAKIVRPIFVPKFMQALRKKIYQRIGAEDYLATPELQKTFVNVVNEDLTKDMEKIKVPALIIWGENDQDTPLEYLYKMKSSISNSRYFILKNAGHFSFLDKSEEFVKVLKEFIDESH